MLNILGRASEDIWASVYNSLTFVCYSPLDLLDFICPTLGIGSIPSRFPFSVLWSGNSLKGQLKGSLCLFLFLRDCSLSFSFPGINRLKSLVSYVLSCFVLFFYFRQVVNPVFITPFSQMKSELMTFKEMYSKQPTESI